MRHMHYCVVYIYPVNMSIRHLYDVTKSKQRRVVYWDRLKSLNKFITQLGVIGFFLTLYLGIVLLTNHASFS